MADADDIRHAQVEAVRLADEERARLTGQVQDDRRDDAPPERELTANQVQQDRRDDQAPERMRTAERIRSDRLADVKASTDQIKRDRRDDEAPRTALELVRADKLTHSIVLLESVRKMCAVLLVVLVALGLGLTYLFDYMGDNRDQIDRSQSATENVERALDDFTASNELTVANHERTQRLVCGWYRDQGRPLPDNGDCAGR